MTNLARLVGLFALALAACSAPGPVPSQGPIDTPSEPVDEPAPPDAPDAMAPDPTPAPASAPVDSGVSEAAKPDGGHPPVDAGAPDVAQPDAGHDAGATPDPCRQWSTAACGLPSNGAERTLYVPFGCSNPDELRCDGTFRDFSHGTEWCCLP